MDNQRAKQQNVIYVFKLIKKIFRKMWANSLYLGFSSGMPVGSTWTNEVKKKTKYFWSTREGKNTKQIYENLNFTSKYGEGVNRESKLTKWPKIQTQSFSQNNLAIPGAKYWQCLHITFYVKCTFSKKKRKLKCGAKRRLLNRFCFISI